MTAQAHYIAGHLDGAAEAAQIAHEYASRFGRDTMRLGSLSQLVAIYRMRGEFEHADRLLSLDDSDLWLRLEVAHALTLGDVEAAQRKLERLASSPLLATLRRLGRPLDALRARVSLASGDEQDAKKHLSKWAALLESLLEENEHIGTFADVLVAPDEALAGAADEHLLERLRGITAGWDALRCANAVNVDRLRGDIALGLGRLDEAQRLYDIGLAWCERERCPVEQGRNLQGLAEVAEGRGEQQQAMEYLDRAGELFNRHGAKLYLDQVLAKKEILKA